MSPWWARKGSTAFCLGRMQASKHPPSQYLNHDRAYGTRTREFRHPPVCMRKFFDPTDSPSDLATGHHHLTHTIRKAKSAVSVSVSVFASAPISLIPIMATNWLNSSKLSHHDWRVNENTYVSVKYLRYPNQSWMINQSGDSWLGLISLYSKKKW